jgi:uridine phosphorylase
MEKGPLVLLFAVKSEASFFRVPPHLVDRVTILYTGIGRERALKSMERVLELRPRLVISSGFAGALVPDLKAGLVVHNADCSEVFRKIFRSISVRGAAFCCVDYIVNTPETKQYLAGMLSGEIVEMESGEILKSCKENGIDAVAVRVILDEYNERIPDAVSRFVAADGSIIFSRLILETLKNPGLPVELYKWWLRSRLSAKALAEKLHLFFGKYCDLAVNDL